MSCTTYFIHNDEELNKLSEVIIKISIQRYSRKCFTTTFKQCFCQEKQKKKHKLIKWLFSGPQIILKLKELFGFYFQFTLLFYLCYRLFNNFLIEF